MLCRIAGNFPQIGEYASGQEVSADKVRCAVGGAFLVASADITDVYKRQYQSHAATIYKWAQEDAAKEKPKKGIPDYSFKEGESL